MSNRTMSVLVVGGAFAAALGRALMRHLALRLVGGAAGLMCLIAGQGEALAAGKIEVTITNLTRAQPLSPPVVASHDKDGPRLFAPGQPASRPLAVLAQDAINGPLVRLLKSNSHVDDVQQGAAPIPPGGSAKVVVESQDLIPFVSVASMLVNTNDAFIGPQHVAVPPIGVRTLFVSAWDAGSEVNDEDCDNIPGPACGDADRSGVAEKGFVHIHNGVHGVADLSPAVHDWRNPVAQIDIRRQ